MGVLSLFPLLTEFRPVFTLPQHPPSSPGPHSSLFHLIPISTSNVLPPLADPILPLPSPAPASTRGQTGRVASAGPLPDSRLYQFSLYWHTKWLIWGAIGSLPQTAVREGGRGVKGRWEGPGKGEGAAVDRLRGPERGDVSVGTWLGWVWGTRTGVVSGRPREERTPQPEGGQRDDGINGLLPITKLY